MSCYDCDEFSQCTNAKGCLHRKKELARDVFYFIGFALFVVCICLVAGIGWGLFERFYPSTAA